MTLGFLLAILLLPIIDSVTNLIITYVEYLKDSLIKENKTTKIGFGGSSDE